MYCRMAESEDVSTLIDHEETEQDVQEAELELGAVQNLGTSIEVLEIPTVGGESPDVGIDNWEFVKLDENHDEHSKELKEEVSDIMQAMEQFDIMKPDKDSKTEKDENLETKKGDDGLDEVQRREKKDSITLTDSGSIDKVNPKQDRGSLDLMKYIIKSPNQMTVSAQAEAVIENAEQSEENTQNPRENSAIPTNTLNNASGTAVSFTNHTVEQGIVNEPTIIIRGMAADNEIQTHVEETRGRETQEQMIEIPFRKMKIKLLQVISFVAIILFFPFGIPAAYFASKIEGEFNKGILRGDIDKANKLIKRTEMLIVFSFIAAFLTVVTVFAVLEHHLIEQDEASLASKGHPGPHLG